MKWFIVWLIYCALTIFVMWCFGMQFHPSFSLGCCVLMCLSWAYFTFEAADDENKSKK